MRVLIRYLYDNDPRPITIGYLILLRPLVSWLVMASLLLMLPWGIVLFCVPGLVTIGIGLISYSSIFKLYYGNRITYWLFIILCLCITVFGFRPLVHEMVKLLIEWSWK